jgi:Amiloride-sensitive sodium channel
VFYKELSYAEVDQQVAFDLLNLLSEIGGLLGLLLGSSVLTVCELVDFIAMLCAIKLDARRRNNGGRQQQRKHPGGQQEDDIGNGMVEEVMK